MLHFSLNRGFSLLAMGATTTLFRGTGLCGLGHLVLMGILPTLLNTKMSVVIPLKTESGILGQRSFSQEQGTVLWGSTRGAAHSPTNVCSPGASPVSHAQLPPLGAGVTCQRDSGKFVPASIKNFISLDRRSGGKSNVVCCLRPKPWW